MCFHIHISTGKCAGARFLRHSVWRSRTWRLGQAPVHSLIRVCSCCCAKLCGRFPRPGCGHVVAFLQFPSFSLNNIFHIWCKRCSLSQRKAEHGSWSSLPCAKPRVLSGGVTRQGVALTASHVLILIKPLLLVVHCVSFE